MNLHDSLEVEDLGRRLLLVEDILHLVLGGLISHPQALLGGFRKVLLILYDCTSAVKDILHLVLVHASSLVDVIIFYFIWSNIKKWVHRNGTAVIPIAIMLYSKRP